MATYTFVPTSLTGGYSISNASNAYTDTDSDTYATVSFSDTGQTALLKFNVSIPQDEIVTSAIVKIKGFTNSSSTDDRYELRTTQDGLLGMRFDAFHGSGTTEVKTLESVFIMQYVESLYVSLYRKIATSSNSAIKIYGAEIIVETSPITKNKVTFGNGTLIDLTPDTVTALDVASGITFHLPSGVQTEGMLEMRRTTSRTYSSSERSITIRELFKEPSWFVLACSSASGLSNRVQYILYDGTTTTTYYTNSSSAGSVKSSTSYGSFSYSNGTLIITVTSTPYFGAAYWDLYYL